MSALDSYVLEQCNSHGWTLVEVLRRSQHKQTITARVQIPPNIAAVVKCAVQGAQSHGFSTEQRFYATERFALAPAVLRVEPHLICVEDTRGPTLRAWAIQHPEAPTKAAAILVEQVISGLAAERCRPTSPALQERAVEAALGRLHNLLTSGPLGVPRSMRRGRVAERVAQGLRAPLRVLLTRVVLRWEERGVAYASRFGHNDLHADNVLVTKMGPKVIDYERVTYPGFWVVDALYLFACSYAAVSNDRAKQELLSATRRALLEREPGMEPELRWLIRLFAAAGVTNSRFRNPQARSPLWLTLARLVATGISRV